MPELLEETETETEELESEPDAYGETETVSCEWLPYEDGLKLYFREINRIPLLKAEEERAITKEIVRTRGLAEEAHYHRQLWETMIVSNLRLAAKIALQYAKVVIGYMEASDLIQEANIGLMKALDKYDPEKGWKFSTYAVWWIRQCVLRAIDDKARVVRIPVPVLGALRKVDKAISEIQEEGGRVSLEALTEKTQGLSKKQVRRVLAARKMKNLLSLHSLLFPEKGDDSDELLGRVEDQKAISPEEQAEQNDLREKVEEVLKELPEKEGEVLKLRFGWDGNGQKTLAEIGLRFGVTRERIRQIEKRALRRLQNPTRRKKLEEFWKEK